MDCRSVRTTLVGATLMILVGCAVTSPPPPPADEVVDEAPVTSAEPPALPRVEDYDFGTANWLFSAGGSEPPVAVTLVEGTASVDSFQYDVGDAVFGDADGDGRNDAAIPISRSDGNEFETLWYVWHDSGEGIHQVPYPIAQQSRCGTAVESATAVDGGFVVHEFLRLTGTDDAVPCSDPGTGELTRTVALHSAEGEIWPVQTSPIAAYGGICPGAPWMDSPGERVSLLAAPSEGAPVATTPDQVVGVYALYESTLTDIDGRAFVGFTQSEVDTGAVTLFCGFHKQ